MLLLLRFSRHSDTWAAFMSPICSDGFMVGALEVGLRFCRPFLDKPDKKQGALQVRGGLLLQVGWLKEE